MSPPTVRIATERDLFGEPVRVRDLPGPRSTFTGRRPTKPDGYAASPGSGPAGESCGTCKYLVRIQKAKTYLKCGLQRHRWTGGPGTDIRARTPACWLWEGIA